MWWNSLPTTPNCIATRRCNAVIRFGKKAEERLIPVKLGARLTEIGTLETWCESKISDNRWNLEFQLRKPPVEQPAERKAAAVVSRSGAHGRLCRSRYQFNTRWREKRIR